jgi:hypothetical protein
MRSIRTFLTTALIAATLAAAPPGASAAPESGLLTPLLIERAVAHGKLDRPTADLYLAYSLGTEWRRVPPAYRGGAPWHGTVWLLGLLDRIEAMEPGPRRAALRDALHSSPADSCGVPPAVGGPGVADSTYFHIHHNSVIGGGLDIEDYKASLDTAWATEVNTLGWAAPPLESGETKYRVVIATLGPGLYGFVSPTDFVGNNPNTPWNEGDAEASCMALNDNYSSPPFPSPPQASLDATTSHEFNHSIQFGYGGLQGANLPDYVFIEGGATWMEDEVFDSSNDNYYYLWPDFADDMGQYKDNGFLEPYGYWITWRGMTERYGTGVPGGGEDVMQQFWELTSKNTASNLDAMNQALGARGTTLADAYHAYAIAVKFNRACGGGYAYPHCLEEGPAYVAHPGAGPTQPHGSIGGIGASHSGSIVDNYALNWIALTAPGPFQLRLKNNSNGGGLRGSVACDTGSEIRVEPFQKVAQGGKEALMRFFNPTGCQSTVAVITNQTQTAANPTFSGSRQYSLSMLPPPKPSRITLKVDRGPDEIEAHGTLRPRHKGERIIVTLYKKKGKKFKKVDRERPRLEKGKRYEADLDPPDGGKCKITARFRGDVDHLPSQKSRSLSC